MQCAIILDNAIQYKFIQAAEKKEQILKRSFKCRVATETNVRIVHVLFLNFSSNNGQCITHRRTGTLKSAPDGRYTTYKVLLYLFAFTTQMTLVLCNYAIDKFQSILIC